MPAEVTVISAHRTPDRMLDYARSAAGRGIQVLIRSHRQGLGQGPGQCSDGTRVCRSIQQARASRRSIILTAACHDLRNRSRALGLLACEAGHMPSMHCPQAL